MPLRCLRLCVCLRPSQPCPPNATPVPLCALPIVYYNTVCCRASSAPRLNLSMYSGVSSVKQERRQWRLAHQSGPEDREAEGHTQGGYNMPKRVRARTMRSRHGYGYGMGFFGG